ncbi:MAG: aminomethyl-transferring glycine dehydrogenase [Cyclobacteriaceae bacterium]|nr:aminomethyl-transferring glycine dehydrogenase [Cyclobacteriaceae bacterium]MCH8517649.1 aminomethyl-transferring glycine dehydrogenase [Cyclobacteriaceae bacterium]
MKVNLSEKDKFQLRHNGPSSQQKEEMLATLGLSSMEELNNKVLPDAIRLEQQPHLPEAQTESEFLSSFKKMMSKNKVFRSFIGMGYYNTHTPSVIQRNILENPGWYTAYTPYQAEIAQGRLEALINFQNMVMDLTAMEIANASLLDEATAAAEAMAMAFSLRKKDKKKAFTYFVDENIFPQTRALLETRAEPLDIQLEYGKIEALNINREDIFGIFVQYPDANGEIKDHKAYFEAAKEADLFVSVAADLLSLTLLRPPGEIGADVVVGSTQRFGIPLGYGGPHAAFFACKEAYKRQIPGRIIGVSIDAEGNKAYRMALQTREQHIKREKATSNICTAQVLLAVMAGMYGTYHGPEGLKNIALKIHASAVLLASELEKIGFKQVNQSYFDTLKINANGFKKKIKDLSEAQEINFRYFEDDHVGISLDETITQKEIAEIVSIFASAASKTISEDLPISVETHLPEALRRTSSFMEHPVYQLYHSEHELLRYMKKLENKDLSLTHSMISLGSCTMKLNATSEMIPLSWPEVNAIHPFVPRNQVDGYYEMFKNLEHWLNEITGFTATSLQPNSGAQGEYAGLMVIRKYHEVRSEQHRRITLIPSSAHGTNPASAVMAGMKVVIVKCDEQGNIDINDLREKADKHKDELAALMVTYPSTHGVFEVAIQEICQIIHDRGGLVYMDGANMNAQVGLTSPARIGADVCHLNLHKTFCIPHGGGGPGMGPICVNDKLKDFLPGSPVVMSGGNNPISAISAAPYGSASILSISYAYIAMMGEAGLTKATEIAILNANYIRKRLENYIPVLYTGASGFSAHELIIDLREFKKEADIEVSDIAKRLMDYGFHSPTVSFPVPGTMMIEPTESETKQEIDRFCDAFISIVGEIKEIIDGKYDKINNVLKHAPHTADVLLSDKWDRPYTRQKAAYPLAYLKSNKFWPSVSRVDDAFGDRNLMCSCIPVEEYLQEEEGMETVS